jgi:hypothetical protein
LNSKIVSLVRCGLAVALIGLGVAGCERSEPKTEGGAPVTRRLTQAQYRQIIADVFGPGIQIAGRMDPDVRKDGLIGVGATEATFTPASLEQYDLLARAIAAEVLQPQYRRAFMPCAPAAENAPDGACAAQVIKEAGRLLFRRPLADQELAARVALINAATAKLGNFYKGLEYGLTSLLVSPSFLFQRDVVEANPHTPGGFTLDSYSKASRLSFFLWDAAPDDILLKAAESGELNTKKGLERQVDRMLASPRLKEGLRSFFSDFLQFSMFDALVKDSVIYPKFSPSVAIDAKEQTLRTIVAHLVTENGDYRDLFTTRKTFMSRALGVVYQVPVFTDEAWMPFEFPENDPRAGLLTQLSFTAMHAHPGRSSATLRGKAIREILLCQVVPTPPANVDFTSFEELSKPGQTTTARERLASHISNPACAGCHKITDPIGLALEQFDGAGSVRGRENGKAIDASGDLDGATFTDAAGLGQAMRNDPKTTACLIDKVFAYGLGRKPAKGDKEWIAYVQARFAKDGYKVPALLRRIATSEAFYRVKPVDAQSNKGTSS